MVRVLAFLLVISSSLACAIPSVGAKGTIENITDDMDGQRYRSLSGVLVARSDGSEYSSEIAVFSHQSSGAASIRVKSVNYCWMWLKCPQVTMSIDGVVFKGEGKHDGFHLYENKCYESLRLPLEPAAIEALKNAKKFRIRACNATSELSPAQLAQVREVLRTTPDATPHN